MTEPKTLKHGTYSAYQRCPDKCDECKAANREYTRQWRAAVRGSLADDDPAHGTTNGHDNYGCRCDRCVAAYCRALADYWLRRAQALEQSTT